MKDYKPDNYTSLSPYLIVDNAQKLVDMLSVVFNASTLRRFDRGDGNIAHIELRLDDSVVMISESSSDYPATVSMLHLYVQDVHGIFKSAIANGCTLIEAPENKDGDPDTRGAFYDPCGNYWAVSTQRL